MTNAKMTVLSGGYVSRYSGYTSNHGSFRGKNLNGLDCFHPDWLPGQDMRGLDFSYAKLKNAKLSGAYLSRCSFKGADLRGADLTGADLTGADFSGADLRGARLGAADLRNARLYTADLRGADLGAALVGSIARLERAGLVATDLRGAKLPDGTMAEVIPLRKREPKAAPKAAPKAPKASKATTGRKAAPKMKATTKGERKPLTVATWAEFIAWQRAQIATGQPCVKGAATLGRVKAALKRGAVSPKDFTNGGKRGKSAA